MTAPIVTGKIVAPLLRREKLLVRLVVALMFLSLTLGASMVYVAVNSTASTRSALDSRDKTAAAATRRINLLTAQIGDLQTQAQDAASQRAALVTKVDVLTVQVRQLGGKPVVDKP